MTINRYTIEADPDFPIQERFNVLVPLNFMLSTDGNLDIWCYESTAELAQRFADEFADEDERLFSDEAFDWIYREYADTVDSWGYAADEKRRGVWLYNFEARDESDLDLSLIREDSMMLGDFRKYKNKTTFNLEMQARQYLRCAVTVQEDAVVSIAGENMRFDEAVTEIGCETNPHYRRQGMAVSNVVLLTQKLLEDNNRVQYNCSCRNDTSRGVAERAGFTQVGRSYYLTCYQK